MTNTDCIRVVEQHFANLGDNISDIDVLDASFYGEQAFDGTDWTPEQKRERALDIAFSVKDRLTRSKQT